MQALTSKRQFREKITPEPSSSLESTPIAKNVGQAEEWKGEKGGHCLPFSGFQNSDMNGFVSVRILTQMVFKCQNSRNSDTKMFFSHVQLGIQNVYVEKTVVARPTRFWYKNA